MRTVAESYSAGGVTSRDNPLSMPLPRGLRCRNWIPTDAGMWKARWGYTALPMTSSTATPIHSMADYQLWNGTQYLLFGQGSNLYRRSSGGAVEVVSLVMSSSNPWNCFRAKNRIYLGNGVDSKWYDGSRLRTNGLIAPPPELAVRTTITEGVREAIGTESSSVSIAQNAGGSFSVTSGSGLQFYMAYFDPNWQELGPANAIGTRQKVTLADRKFDFSALPNLSAVDANWLKLLAATDDDSDNAYFCAVEDVRTAAIDFLWTDHTKAFDGKLRITLNAHGYSTGDVLMISGIEGSYEFNGPKSIEVIDPNTFSFMCHTDSAGLGGVPKVQKLLVVANAGTTASIVQTKKDSTMLANAERGLPIPVVQSDTPGYGFYVAYWNKSGGGHIGNRTALSKRIKNTYRVNVRFKNLPQIPINEYNEVMIVVGRTMDGAKIPYAMSDSALNWFAVPANHYTFQVGACSFANVDFDTELPTRNGIIPAADKFARVGSRYYCNTPNSPYIYFSASEDNEKFPLVGDAAQCWAPNDFLTFPTGETVSGIHECDLNLWCFSRHALAISAEVSGVQGWAGTWYGMGLAGQRAFVKTPYGPFWLTGAKQLATRGDMGPVTASDEYEAALLSKIGSAYMSKVELVYALDPSKRIDQVIIKAQDKDGKPFEVVHDFKLRDDRGAYGQGYERVYNGALAQNYTLAQVEDSDFVKRAWAGGADGVIYQTIDGYSDHGEEFDCDWIGLVNAGTNRPFIEEFSFFGDQAVKISYLKNLNNHGEGDFSPLVMKARVPLPVDSDLIGGDQNHEYFGNVKAGEMKFCYVRLQLTTHSADAPSSPLNDPPHLPLETYGTVYVTRATFQGQRGTE